MKEQPFNLYQRAAIEAYGGGEFNGLTKTEHCKDVGDTLFNFVMLELADEADYQLTRQDAIGRVEAAMRDLEIVLRALEIAEPLDLHIRDFLPVRVVHALLNHTKVETARDLVQYDVVDLSRVPNIGKVAVQEIILALGEHGLKLAEKVRA